MHIKEEDNKQNTFDAGIHFDRSIQSTAFSVDAAHLFYSSHTQFVVWLCALNKKVLSITNRNDIVYLGVSGIFNNKFHFIYHQIQSQKSRFDIKKSHEIRKKWFNFIR